MSTPPTPSRDIDLSAIEAVIDTLTETLPAPPRREGPGRPPVISPLIVWTSVLLAVLRGYSSQRDIWRIATSRALSDDAGAACSDQTIYNRLAQGQPAMQQLFGQVSTVLRDRLAASPVTGCHDLAPFATMVVALDETTLDPVRRRLPDLRQRPSTDLLPGKLSLLFDLRTQQWLRLDTTTDAAENEKVLARQTIADLPRGSLILADLGYFGFAWFDELTTAGQFWVSRMRERTSFETTHTFYRDGTTVDELIWLGTYRADRTKYMVRQVTFAVGGRRYRYLTNQCDPHRLSLHDIARLYARRWDIEMAVQLLKEHLQLRLLWSAKPEVVWMQVWAALIVSQILQAVRLEIAARAGVDPFEVSMPLLVRYVPYLLARQQDPLAVFVRDGRRLEFIRPSRRTHIQAPSIDSADITPRPPDLVMTRQPRYARKTTGRKRPSSPRT